MDKSAFDTKEFSVSVRKGSRQAWRGLLCFLFACILLVASAVGVLGGAWFYAKNRDESGSSPVIHPSPVQTIVSANRFAVKTEAIVQICVASETEYVVGSGIVISEDGYLLTCDHLFEDLDSPSITVSLSDGTVLTAAYVGGDDRADIAVLKVERRQMAFYSLDPSVEVALGNRVIAIGCPDEASQTPTITAGILSSTGVRISIGTDYPQRLLQIDAPVSPGYSGGAVIDEQGNWIGVVCAKQVNPDTEGVAYAIPISTISGMVDELIQNGCLSQRPKLGLSFRFVSPGVAEATGTRPGLLLTDVPNPSDLYVYGFTAGDRVVAIEGNPILSLDDLYDRLESASADDLLPLTILRRDGQERCISLPVSFEKGRNSYSP